MTPAELRERLARRAEDAAAMHASAPVADVLAVVLAELETVDGLPTTRPAPDQWLTLAETAQRLSVPKRWLTENRHQLPFIKTLIAGGAVRCSEAGLRRWLATR